MTSNTVAMDEKLFHDFAANTNWFLLTQNLHFLESFLIANQDERYAQHYYVRQRIQSLADYSQFQVITRRMKQLLDQYVPLRIPTPSRIDLRELSAGLTSWSPGHDVGLLSASLFRLWIRWLRCDPQYLQERIESRILNVAGLGSDVTRLVMCYLPKAHEDGESCLPSSRMIINEKDEHMIECSLDCMQDFQRDILLVNNWIQTDCSWVPSQSKDKNFYVQFYDIHCGLWWHRACRNVYEVLDYQMYLQNFV